MTQLSTKTYRARRFAVLCFFVFTALFVAVASRPWVSAQAGWRVDLKEGETAASSLSINNRCKTPHNFRVESKFKSLRFDEPTDSIRIEQGATRTIPAVFNAHGLKEKVYRGNVEVECLDCKEEAGCNQDRDELAVEMTVVKAVTNVAKGNNAVQSQDYTLNKYPCPGSTTVTLPTSQGQDLTACNPAITTWSIGVPILYVITVQDPSSSTTLVSRTLTDDLGIGNNPHFKVLNVNCKDAFGAICGPLPTNSNPPLNFSFQIKGGGLIVLEILGYYDAAQTFSNTASVFDPANPTTPLASQTKTVAIQAGWPQIDLRVAKTSSTSDTSLPATEHYTVTLTGDSTYDFYPGSLLRIKDTVRAGASPLLTYQVTTPLGANWCTSVLGSTCPAAPSPSSPAPFTSGAFSYANFYMSWPSSPSPVIKKGDTITMKFDLKASATCGEPSTKIENLAAIEMSGFSYSDANNANNSSNPLTSNSFTTNVQPCPPITPIATITKERVCPSGGCPTVNWGGTVTYEIKVTNLTNTAQPLQVADYMYKQSGPPLKVTLSPSGTSSDIQCAPTTVSCTTTTSSPQSLINDGQSYSLFKTDFTLPANGQVALTFDVKIDKLADCEMNSPGFLTNFAQVWQVPANQQPKYVAQSQTVTVELPKLDQCKMKVTKTLDQPANGVTFGQTVSFTITYESVDPSQAITVHTLRDYLNLRDAANSSNSGAYGNVPITGLSVSCNQSGGVSPMPALNQTATQIFSSSPDWKGISLIQETSTAAGITFPANSKLTCSVSFTPQAPSATDNLCQGEGRPEIVNSAFMDVSGLQYSNIKPSSPYFAQVSTPLPLCRKLAILKTPVDDNGNAVTSTGPGGVLTFQIKITNLGPDPVSNFILTDSLPPWFSYIPSSLVCPAVCLGPGFSGQTLTENFATIPGTKLSPTNSVTVSFKVNAPITGGKSVNTAIGSFGAGGNFFFEGDPKVLLENSAEVQVLTPVLTKSFNPNSLAINGAGTAVFTITNMNSDPAQSGISFTDLLPSGVTVTGVPSTACGGTVSFSGNAVSLSNGALAQGQHTCQFSVELKANSCGTFVNDRSNFSKVTNLDVTNVDTSLTVTGCPPKDTPKLEKEFKPDKIGPNGTTTLAFTVTNSSGDPKQTDISFSETLSAGLQIVSVVSNGCSGVVSVSSDGRTVTLTGGQLVGSNADGSGKHSCTIMVKVKVVGECGVYRNTKENFSEVKNLDISGAQAQLQVDCGPSGSGLIVQKKVEGAPPGFSGQFNFLVQCATPNGFYQKAVTVNWPTPGFTVLNDVPAGSQCVVTEGPPPASLPANYAWSGLPSYLPQGGVVSVGPRGGQVTVTDTLSLCNESGQVTITKVVKGLPKDYIGVFEGTLQCWVGDKLQTFPVTLTSPNGLTTTIGDIPLGSTCTFQETGQPPLTGDFKWDQPVYSPLFGTVTLRGECCQQITVTNHARHCCLPTQGSGGGPVTNYSLSLPGLTSSPAKPPPARQRPARRRNGE